MSAGTRRAAQRVQPRARTRPRTSCRSGSSPTCSGIAPGYEQKRFADAEKRGRLRLVASPDGADGSVHDPRRRAPVCRPVRRRRVGRARARPEAQGLRARGARRRSRSTAQTLAAGDAAELAGRVRADARRRRRMPRCWCSTSPELADPSSRHQWHHHQRRSPCTLRFQDTAGPGRPHPARRALHALGLRQDRRLRRHRRLHRLRRAADAARSSPC